MSERPELSKKSPYWIERHRYYELKHFCRQYDYWKNELYSVGLIQSRSYSRTGRNVFRDPVFEIAERRELYLKWIEMVESAAKETDPVIGSYILEAVTKGLPYDNLKAKLGIPCCKELYYSFYRKFFWILSQKRK